MTNSIREALESAVQENEKDETNTPADATESVSTSTTEPTTDSAPEGRRDEPEKEAGRPEKDATESVRDTTEKPEPEKESVQEKPVKRASLDRPPASWKAGAKERWGSLPQEAREEITRREREINQGLQQAAEGRKFAETFQQTIAPYQAVLMAEGVQDPLVAVKNLFQTVGILRMGTPAQKAMQVAQIIENYGIDIPSLDKILSGNAQQVLNNPESRVEELVNKRLAPIQQKLARFEEVETGQIQRVQQEAAQTIEQFAARPENVFFDDVREDMGDLLDLATKRGRVMTLEQAYERACAQHPEISKVIAQRAAAKNSADINRARNASSSVKGAPAGGGGSAPTDIRSSLMAAMNKE